MKYAAGEVGKTLYSKVFSSIGEIAFAVFFISANERLCPASVEGTRAQRILTHEIWELSLYGSKWVSLDFENKKPLNFKHWIFMHWNDVSEFFAALK